MSHPPFSIFYNEDGYTTDQKIMGRQVSGKSFLAGVTRAWPQSTLSAVCQSAYSGNRLIGQLQELGFKGNLSCSLTPSYNSAQQSGCLYYPAPPALEVAAGREQIGPTSFSIMGVTHTLSSQGGLGLISALALPPFRPWDALICTSAAAHTLVSRLIDETQQYWRQAVGATRFNQPVLPVIPLGIDASDLAARQTNGPTARAEFGIQEDEIVFLFAGRLSIHAKCNPGPVYIALERLAARHRITCVEAGIYPNSGMRAAMDEARQKLAPSVRFIWADGAVDPVYEKAWQAADIFISLSDNIQETFGLTPLEAMARGLPVIVSDWDGYKDTVRDGIDGFRVPTVAPPPGAGAHLMASYVAANNMYDGFIGGVSMATVVDIDSLCDVIERLATDPDLRHKMGQSGQRRTREVYDWSVVLGQYCDLTNQLRELRVQADKDKTAEPLALPQHADPFYTFGHFPTAQLKGSWVVTPKNSDMDRLQLLQDIFVSNYVFEGKLFGREVASQLLASIPMEGVTVDQLLATNNLRTQFGVRALMWLWKFDLVRVRP